ncbi:MAG: putative DNA-binding domain-containing protein [Proteobacteria bacterium]|nr:putative DNA-binding domain-containing protein [Pseudomonadota bacterium]
MSALKQIQDDFQHYLVSGVNDILPSISEDKRFSARNRLLVYFDAYRIRLMEILKLDFPKTHTLLGDDLFEEAFIQYLTKHIPTHFSVRYFGQHFSQFLATTKPYSDFPVFAEMALFEWSVSHTLDAKDDMLVTQQALGQISPEEWADLHFEFHPSLISQYFHWDTPQLWQDIELEREPRQPMRQAAPMRWLFWRKGLRSLFQSCTPTEDIMFQAVLAKKSFAQICEDLLDTVPEDAIPMTVAQTLFKWISEEMISKMEVKSA